METIKQFFIDNSSQIWTLISVVVGGFVTYISTYGIEQRKNKFQSQREKVDKVLIPFCTHIEETIKAIDPFGEFDNSIFYNRALLSYLSAEKRVFLPKSLRVDLQKYSDTQSNLFDILDQECKDCCLEYNRYIEAKIINSSFSNGAMYIEIVLDHLSRNKIATAILGKEELSLREDIKKIRFVINDDPECYKALDFSFDSELINLHGAIQNGVIEESDVDDAEARFRVALFDFIHEVTFDEKEKLTSFINETQSSQALMELYALLKKMHKSVIKIIDKVTM